MKKVIYLFVITIIFSTLFLSSTGLVFAADDDTNLVNPINTDKPEILIGIIIQAFLGVVGAISLLMFVYGGFMMLTSRGKSEQIKKGQETLIWASLGILIVFTAYTILKFAFSALGL